MKTKAELASILVGMNYRELCDLGTELSDMIDKDVRPKIETPIDFANLLSDWAQANAAA